MTPLDWGIIIAYVLSMIGLSIWLSRGQTDGQDYYLAGRDLPWWAVGISVVATQSSAISFVSIPAFVALREGGGLTWLQYELAVPLAMLVVGIWLLPYFRQMRLMSVFEFLRIRFGEPTARFLSFIFLLSRGFGTGVMVYATALVMASLLDWPLTPAILLIGVSALIYDTFGGIKAVVVSDVIQLVLIVAGAMLSIGLALDLAGGWSAAWASFGAERQVALDLRTGLGEDGSAVPFWAFLFGGFVLYASYYGTDQSQVQRVLATRNAAEARKALWLNGMARLPLTLLYVGLGVALAGAFAAQPELRAAVPADRLDALVPEFIRLYVPVGAKGLILAAILSAAMSSLDSAINALSAVTMQDYIERWATLSPRQQLWWGKATTIGWGVAVTGLAFLAGGIDRTVIEAINKVGSAFYGPVLATFVLGALTRGVGGPAIIIGVVVGVGVNVTCWLTAAPLHWMWWNVLGFGVTVIVAWFGKFFLPHGRNELTVGMPKPRPWRFTWAENRLMGYGLMLWAGLILVLLIWLTV